VFYRNKIKINIMKMNDVNVDVNSP